MKSSLEPADTFFEHGIYVLDTTKPGSLLGVFTIANCGQLSPIAPQILVRNTVLLTDNSHESRVFPSGSAAESMSSLDPTFTVDH